MGKEKIWINGKLVKEKDAKISVFDRGFLYGDGVFETMRGYNGAVFMVDAHLDRLFRSLGLVGIRLPRTKKYLKSALYRTMKANRLSDAYIRLSVTRGEGRFGIGYRDRFYPNIVIVAKKFEGYPAWMHEKGTSAAIVKIRQNELSPLSGIKSANFLNCILARFEAKREGADEAILLNTKGHVVEGATSNIFIVKSGRLITPPVSCGLLPGITRGAVLRLARQLKMKVSEAPMTRRRLVSADEAFFTNSLAEILPIVRVDSRRIGAGRPGPITGLLCKTYRDTIKRLV